MKRIFFLLLFCGVSMFCQNKKELLSTKFHKQKRQFLRSKMPKNSVALFFANPIRNRSNDINYVYHQDPNFYYLTGLTEPNAVLVLFSEQQKGASGKIYDELLYLREKNAFYELWQGKMLGVKDGEKVLDITTKSTEEFVKYPINFKKFDVVFLEGFQNDVRDNKKMSFDLYDLIETFKNNSEYNYQRLSNVKKQLYQAISSITIDNKNTLIKVIDKAFLYDADLKKDAIINGVKNVKTPVQFEILKDRAKEKLAKVSNIDTEFLRFHLAQMREVKEEEELKLLKKAIDISVVGQIEMMKAMQPHMSETEVQGVHEFVYKKYGVGYEGYPSIVGSGNNGCTLHYIKNDKPHIEDGDLVLMDLGAEYGGYSADITRTIPANGKFTSAQKKIYELVLKAQLAGIKAAVVGNSFRDPHYAAKKVINQGLKDLGIIKSVDQKHNYFPHGTSHYLGLDVHDLGTKMPLKHNTVITVEPGIYIPNGSKCKKKWWGIGIRIEDDILVTDKGPVNLSKEAPRTVIDIEKMMQEKSILNSFILPKIN